MKMNKFFMGILGALALTACSSEEVITPDKPNLPGEGEPRYMSVSIRNVSPGTRAGGEQTADGDKTYEEGYENENYVKTLRFYFFKANGDPVIIKTNGQGGGQSYYDCTEDKIEPVGPNMPNVEEILKAIIVINSDEATIKNDIKQMVAVANFTSIQGKLENGSTKNLSLSELQAIIGTETECNVAASSDNGFLLTSSCYYDGGTKCAVSIDESNIKNSKELAMQDPVDVYVERVVAKIRVKTNWTDPDMNELTDVTLDGVSYKAIKIQEKINGVATNVTTTIGDQEVPVYVIFKKWDLWWTADQSYLFKKIGDWDNILGWNWNDKPYFRSYWAENPQNTKLNKHPHNFASKKLIQEGDNITAKNYAEYSSYCLENAADDYEHPGLKKTYNPDVETTNRTLVYLQAVLVTVDDQGVATPLTLAEFAATRSTETGIMAAMFAPNQNVVYFRSKEPISTNSDTTIDPDGTTITEGTKTYAMIAVTVDDLRIVSAEDADLADQDSENSPRYLSYLNLKDNASLFGKKTYKGEEIEVEDGKLYHKDATGKFVAYNDLNEVNNLYESVGGAKVWRDGNTYYYHEINHLAPSSIEKAETKGLYGVVRNHIYEVELNSVFGLGTPVLTPEDGEDPEDWKDIVPQKPKNSFFLGARLNILSWRVVSNKVGLEW